MAKNAFVWDYAAAGDLLLRSDAIAGVCEEQAERMTRATGMEYQSDVRLGLTRVRAGGYTAGEGESDSVCPKCGYDHPNCNCRPSR